MRSGDRVGIGDDRPRRLGSGLARGTRDPQQRVAGIEFERASVLGLGQPESPPAELGPTAPLRPGGGAVVRGALLGSAFVGGAVLDGAGDQRGARPAVPVVEMGDAAAFGIPGATVTTLVITCDGVVLELFVDFGVGFLLAPGLADGEVTAPPVTETGVLGRRSAAVPPTGSWWFVESASAPYAAPATRTSAVELISSVRGRITVTRRLPAPASWSSPAAPPSALSMRSQIRRLSESKARGPLLRTLSTPRLARCCHRGWPSKRAAAGRGSGALGTDGLNACQGRWTCTSICRTQMNTRRRSRARGPRIRYPGTRSNALNRSAHDHAIAADRHRRPFQRATAIGPSSVLPTAGPSRAALCP